MPGTLDVDTEGPRLAELTHPASAADTDDLSGGKVLVTLVLVVVTGTDRTGEVIRVVPIVARGTALTGGAGILRGTVALFPSLEAIYYFSQRSLSLYLSLTLLKREVCPLGCGHIDRSLADTDLSDPLTGAGSYVDNLGNINDSEAISQSQN